MHTSIRYLCMAGSVIAATTLVSARFIEASPLGDSQEIGASDEQPQQDLTLDEAVSLALQLIASDGRPLPAPITTTEHLVAPGERFDILFQMPPAANRTASVDYYDIRLAHVLGTASTSVVTD